MLRIVCLLLLLFPGFARVAWGDTLPREAVINFAAADGITSELPTGGQGFTALPGLQEPGGSPEFLSPEKAFLLTMSFKDARTLVAHFKPAEGYYLYKDRIAFAVESPLGAGIAKVNLPGGEIKDDPNFGRTEVYHRPFDVMIRLGEPGGSEKLRLRASYQGCSEKGLCYQPITKKFDLLLTSAGRTDGAVPPSMEPRPLTAVAAGVVSPTEAPPVFSQSDESRIATLFQGGSFWLIVASFLGAGLLLALTPCVFPMIPILSGIIVGQGGHVTKTRGFILSLAYVLGMAITYALAGVAAGLSGTMLSAALQNPWVLGGFAAVFVLLALSMFGLYELQMPSFIQSKVTDTSNRIAGGRVTGVFLMGALSAVVVGPCVAAPLAGALLYIGKTHNVVLGGSALFAMALGMGVPLLFIGLSAGALLPKAGAWMQSVKNFFGVLLLGVAIWLISPVIPALAHMLSWAVLLIVSAIYLHALDPLPAGASGFKKLWKGAGVIAFLMGAALVAGALSGSRDILQPLAGFRAGDAVAASPAPGGFARVKTAKDLDERIRSASGRPVMLDFYADWCVSCKEMERFSFNDAKVQARLKNFVTLQADVTANTEADTALLKRFDLFGPPGIIFFDAQGEEIRDRRVIGYQPPEKFAAVLDTVLSQR